MPSLLKPRLALTFSLILAIASLGKATAQCGKIMQNGNDRIIASLENYQYINTSTGYYSLLVQTKLTRNKAGVLYSLRVVYTGNIAHANPVAIGLKTDSNVLVIKQLNLEKAVKNDDSRVRSKVYTVNLSSKDVEQIKNNKIALIEVSYKNPLKPINITVNDPDFLKDQLDCIANL